MTTLSVDVVSDLHVEGWEGYAQSMTRYLLGRHVEEKGIDWLARWKGRLPPAEVLVVAGDIANEPKLVAEVLRQAAGRWRQVLWVDGNHEHYSTESQGMDVDRNLVQLDGALQEQDNVVRLEEGRVWDHAASGTRFIGCNAWYDWRGATGDTQEIQRMLWQQSINDSIRVRFGRCDPAERAEKAAGWVRWALKVAEEDDAVRRCVVVTHTVPKQGEAWQGVYARPETHGFALNGSFGNSLMGDVASPKLEKWIYGHTHARCRHHDGEVDWICNPRGWPNESDDVYAPVRLVLGEETEEKTKGGVMAKKLKAAKPGKAGKRPLYVVRANHAVEYPPIWEIQDVSGEKPRTVTWWAHERDAKQCAKVLTEEEVRREKRRGGG